MKTTGLTLVEAIKSGRKFKRAHWGNSCFGKLDSQGRHIAKDENDYLGLSTDDILAEDYELEPAKVEIDREMLAKAWDAICEESPCSSHQFSPTFANLCKELGL